MRKGWLSYRFDEVFDLQMGKTPDRKSLHYYGGDNVWVSIRDMISKEITDSSEHITDEAIKDTNIRKVKRNTVIMSFKLTVGKCGIAAKDLYTNEAIMAFNLREGFSVDSSFLYYYLQGYQWDGANKAVMGITLNKATISRQLMEIPPLSIQQSIVAELDKINELISLKKSQMNDLDALAQSIFYDMFGDPVVNEKGWEVKRLKELCSKISDGTHNSPANDVYGKYMYITAKNIKKDGIILDNVTFVSETDHRAIYKRCDPKLGDVLYIKDGVTTGVATINNLTEEFSLLSSVALLRPSKKILSFYLKCVLNTPTKYNQIRSEMGGAAITRLTVNKIERISIPLPPLPLQQSFAAKIEAIERQKQQVKQSLKDLETLLASRMQYWFEEE